MKKKKVQSKESSSKNNVSLSIKYDNMNKRDEFKIRILERLSVKVLGILENRRP